MEFIKSPLNYTGGKFKLLPKIMPLFLEGKTFIDLFGLMFPNNKEQLNFFIERFKRERKI